MCTKAYSFETKNDSPQFVTGPNVPIKTIMITSNVPDITMMSTKDLVDTATTLHCVLLRVS